MIIVVISGNKTQYFKLGTKQNSMVDEIMETLKSEKGSIDSNETMIYKKILNQSQNWAVPEGKKEEAIWNSIESRLDKKTKVVPMTPWFKWAASAAAVILIAFSLILIQPDEQNYFADGITEISLPDGSSVTLNAGTSMSFSESFFGARNVSLEGEGFFEVTPGKEFTVTTSNGIITVLGTSFDVSSLGNDFSVKCYTGKVKVANLENEAILTPGEEVSALNGVYLGVVNFDTSTGKEWTEGIFYYKNEPIIKVFAEIGRQFNVEITFDIDNMNRSYSGLFSNQDNLDDVLKTICAPMELSFELVESNKYVVR